MARRENPLGRFNPANILDGITKFVERVFTGGEPSPRAPPERGGQPPSGPPPPRAPPPGGGGPPNGDNERAFRAVWRDTTNTGAGREYRDEFEIFISLPGVADEPEDTQLDLWEHYIETWVTNERDRRDFENEFGIDLDRDFPWDEWRAARGYNRGK